MSHLPVKRVRRAPRIIDADPAGVIEPRASRGGAFSFSYSYTEITATGAGTRVKSRRAHFADGKLSKESFEGEFDRRVYDDAVADAQRAFNEGASLMLRTFASFFALPGAKTRDER